MNDAIAALSARKRRDQQIKTDAQNLAKIFQASLDLEKSSLPSDIMATERSRRLKPKTSETQLADQVSTDAPVSIPDSPVPEKAVDISGMGSETEKTAEPANVLLGSDPQKTETIPHQDSKQKKPTQKRSARKMTIKNAETFAVKEEFSKRIVIKHDSNIYFMKTQGIEEKCVWLLTEAQREKAFREIPRVGFWATLRTILIKFKSLQSGGYMCDEMMRIFPFFGPAGCNGIIISQETQRAIEEINLPGMYGYFK